ncbi:MAG: M23 family metallopeptidase [Phycisphaerales bacterium]|nr:MAG: M23 family metallopeptidase [Phycisphaerales bacterium]
MNSETLVTGVIGMCLWLGAGGGGDGAAGVDGDRLAVEHAGGRNGAARFAGGLRGGGPIAVGPADQSCVPATLRSVVRQAVSAARAPAAAAAADGASSAMPGRAGGEAAAESRLYDFYPMAGSLRGDIFNGGFADLDGGPGFHDFDCRPFTYDGHAGIDTEIRSFGEQDVGVPVFAVLPGRVIFAQDGYPDKNVNGGEQGNIVGLDHGQGRWTWYYHLKKNSVAVRVGDDVPAGRQIGMVGSSGNSYGPHLHFESQNDEVPVEVFAGPCRPGESGWRDQEPLDHDDLHLMDFATTEVDLDGHPGLPFEMPRSGQIGLDDPMIRFWLKGVNLPVESDWRVRFYRPDGSLALDSAWFFFNEEVWRSYWFWWEYDVPDMHTITGTWHVLVEFNGQEMVRAPIEVRQRRTPKFNRPPVAVTVRFDPPAPREDDVLFCRLDSPVLLDDLDYDIVRYRYVWRVGGEVVRDVVSAGQSDALVAFTARDGDVVSCTVTPGDGRANGPATGVEVEFGMAGDLDGDRDIDLDDYRAFFACTNGPQRDPAPECGENVNADLDGDRDVDLADFSLLAGNHTGPR